MPSLAGILLCVAARYVSIWFGRRMIRRIGLAVSYHLRHRLYEHLQRQGPAFFAHHRTGDLMARAINDIGLIRQMVGLGTRTVFVLVFSAAVGFAFMIYESPSLALLVVPPLPAIFVTALVMSRRVHHQSLLVQEGFSTLSERTQENLAGIRTIQALTQEPEEIRRFGAVNDDFVERYMDLIRTNSLISVFMPGLSAAATLIVIFFGGSRVLAGEISLGTFTAFLWYLNMVLWPVREAGNMINLFQRGSAGIERLFELLEHEPEIADEPAPGAPRQLRGGLEVRALTYRYPGSARPALADVSFRAEPGQRLGVLGRVGSGKSTLLRVLVRMLDPAPGSGAARRPRRAHASPRCGARAGRADAPGAVPVLGHAGREPRLRRPGAPPGEGGCCRRRGRPRRDRRGPAGRPRHARGRARRDALRRAEATPHPGPSTRAPDAPVLLLDDPFSSVDSETEVRILAHLAGAAAAPR